MINLNSIAKRYDLSERDFECVYYDTLNTVRKISGKINEDLFVKYMYDKLEEQGIKYKDAEKIIDFYQTELTMYQAKKEKKAIDKIMEGEDAEDAIEEEMQTSNNTGIDSDIGRNKAHGYTFVVDSMYEDEDEEALPS